MKKAAHREEDARPFFDKKEPLLVTPKERLIATEMSEARQPDVSPVSTSSTTSGST